MTIFDSLKQFYYLSNFDAPNVIWYNKDGHNSTYMNPCNQLVKAMVWF